MKVPPYRPHENYTPQVVHAFEKWLAGSGLMLAQESITAKIDTFMFQVFEAGWNAARAEPRSDAAVPVGGRSPEDGGLPRPARR